ncbi:unnamed protein product [Symbiodinium natans]|uniref:Uncharacterized protein n=1 Tax=Symbiodinium natans TaxID=878477 RepID=A0A812SCT7_9DINO|nr:unnamed protein product [Symbiodinium natans]
MAKSPQRVLEVQLENTESIAFRGFYVEVGAGRMMYRKIRDSGEWAPFFLGSDEQQGQQNPGLWTIHDDDLVVKARSAQEASAPWDACWELAGSGARGSIVVKASELSQLPADARREAKAFFKDPIPFTRFRAKDCPKNCKQTRARDWGLDSVGSLYAHLCFYHWGCEQYHRLHRKHWKESVAEALRQREETAESLLSQFSACLRKHGYEQKAVTTTVDDHTRRVQDAAAYLQRTVSRELPSEDAAEELRGWDKDKSRRGHYSVSFKWFAKWLEVNAMQEMLSGAVEWEDLPAKEESAPGATVSVAQLRRPPAKRGTEASSSSQPSSKRAKPAADDDSDVELVETAEPARGTSKSQADPLRAILSRSMEVLAPRTSQGGGASAGGKPATEVSQRPPHRLAALYEVVRTGGQKAASGVAATVEAKGGGVELASFVANPKYWDDVWLWGYCGVRDREVVLSRMTTHYTTFAHLLLKLLAISRSPRRAPDDLLPIFEKLCYSTPAGEQLTLKPLEKLARKGFQVARPLAHLESESAPSTLLMAVAGAEIGRIMARWPATAQAVAAWWVPCSRRLVEANLPQWMHGVALAAGFWCNYRHARFEDEFRALARQGPTWLALDKDFNNLKKQASQALKALAGEATDAGQGEVSLEQRLRLERSRQAALEKKQQRETAPLHAQKEEPPAAQVPPAEAAGPRLTIQEEPPSAQVPPAEAAGPRLTIQELEEKGELGLLTTPLRGKIVYRSDHKTGTGFHVRVGDPSGLVDVKFWDTAASSLREHPALRKGNEVQLKGFQVCSLKGKSLDFAPPGRRIFLNCTDASSVDIRLVQAAPMESAAKREMELSEALEQPIGAYVTISSAFVSEVDELTFVQTKDGEKPLRIVWLSAQRQSARRTRWSLWGETALTYGPKQLRGQRLSIRGALVKSFQLQVQLAGCFREGGIQLLPDAD